MADSLDLSLSYSNSRTHTRSSPSGSPLSARGGEGAGEGRTPPGSLKFNFRFALGPLFCGLGVGDGPRGIEIDSRCSEEVACHLTSEYESFMGLLY